ncbi:MAG TPA: DUF2207 domain-containing protein [Mycobacteriales bacterium]|jgi:hypothetical protein|nr:DUF2207 domain-containing protein [Mycobacteriales bacterium]
MRRVLAAVLVLVALAAPAASAQAGSERITRYTVDLELRPDGRLHVVETIVYDFALTPRHGIYRIVPDRFRYDRDNDRVEPIRNVRVTGSPGTPTKTKVEHGGNATKIRVGDPDRTITGTHTYTLAYDVDGSVNRFEDHDELYWNAIGDEWTVPIADARVTVRAEATIGEASCFAGPRGSNLPCGSRTGTARAATFAKARLGPGSAMTIAVALPRGYAATPGPLLVEHRTFDKAFSRSPLALGLAALLLLLGLGTVLRLLSVQARDRAFAGQVPGLEPPGGEAGSEERVPLTGAPEGPIEYRPDDTMRPALMGVLLDERADPLDVTATIVDLAVRRFLTIEELPRSGLFRRRDWQLSVQPRPEGDELSPWEERLLTGLFAGRGDVRVSDLKKSFHATYLDITEALYDDVVAHGWFTRRPDKERGRWYGIGVVVVVAGGLLTFLLAQRTHLALVGVPVVLTGLLLLAVHRRMPFRTARGTAARTRALGFKRYLATAEANQLRFEEQEGIFARYLPYAVVLGETERWAKAFRHLADDPQSDLYWFSGPHGWSANDFSDSIGDFSTATAGTFTSAASSGHSGLGGGGSSGGGGGGGGGGSW